MMKSIFLVLTLFLNCYLCFCQTKNKKIDIFFKVGPIFNSFDPNMFNSRNSEAHNRWNLELGVHHPQTGLSILARYISGRSFINNPIFRESLNDLKNIYTYKKGDLFIRENNVSNFSFLLMTDVLANLVKKHRLEVGLGTMRRTGNNSYFEYLTGSWGYPELTEIPLDNWGILGRLSYSYIPIKNLSLSINGEYARFKENPKDIYNFSFLVGTYF